MRYSMSKEFSEALAAWDKAYRFFCDTDFDRQADENAAGDAEDVARDRLMAITASTAAEVAAKLDVMKRRDVDACWTDLYPRYMAQIALDLAQLDRPAVSPTFRTLFNAWRPSWVDFCAAAKRSDDEAQATSSAHSAAFVALMEAPCVAAGDFIVKRYVQLLTLAVPPDGGWYPNEEWITDLYSDGIHGLAAAKAELRDIFDTDLGRCLRLFGLVDFDPRQWVELAVATGMKVHVIINQNGALALHYTDVPGDRQLMQVLCGPVSKERLAQLTDWIVNNEPSLVIDLRSECALVGEAA